MLISNKLTEMINSQIGHEFEASNIYLQIAAFFDSEVLPATAQFFFRQSQEERDHAMKMLRYILDAGGKLAIPAIPAAPTDVDSAEGALKLALEWELVVTGKINALMDQALEENDHIAQDFLRWFVTEQLEEVSTMESLLKVTRRIGANLEFLEHYVRENSSGGAAAAGVQ